MEDLYLPPRSRKTLQQLNQSESEGNCTPLNILKWEVLLLVLLGGAAENKCNNDNNWVGLATWFLGCSIFQLNDVHGSI